MVQHSALATAEARFRRLLDNPRTPEREFQRLFSEYPQILTRALPVDFSVAELIPQGRLGESGADFLIYPRVAELRIVYGAIEIKRPASRIVTVQRNNVLRLTSTAATALAQAQESIEALKVALGKEIATPYMGVSEHIFLIIGMWSDLKRKVCSDPLRRQFKSLLPPNASIVPYDILRLAFERTFFPTDKIFFNEARQAVIENTNWEASVDACLQCVRESAGPDSPDAYDIAHALDRKGQRSDSDYVLTLLKRLVAEGALAETDSLYPPWETLYYIPKKR